MERTRDRPRLTDLSLERLKEVLRYDYDTGEFFWTLAKAGVSRKRAAGCVRGSPYVRIRIDGVLYLGHRLAWLYAYGEWPDGDLDHIDRNPANNRLSNLRIATQSQNNANIGARCNNKIGLKGVSWSKAVSRWQAQICRDQQRYHLGFYDDPEAAHAAYAAAAKELFGEFARVAA